MVIASVSELPREVRDRIEHGDGDCTVTRPGARTGSVVVDAASAALLERFRTPSTVVEAVLAYSAAAQLDPRRTLEDCFGMLGDLAADGLLLAADSKLAEPIATSLRPGERVGGFAVMEPVHVVVDTEVYLARAADGSFAGLKLARAGSERELRAALRHEANVLGRLDARVTPRLLASGEHEGRPYLVQSWCAGVDVFSAANEARQLGPPHDRAVVSRLAESVIAAYAHLHAQGMAHGDVHPRNVLVADGGVSLIDFGLAGELGPRIELAAPARGGIDFFLAPEHAVARLAGEPPPALSAAAEQYSVAALVYLLLTGEYTQDFSLEPEEMLRQLVERPPLSFERRKAEGMEAVEDALTRALSADPADRFDSLAAFGEGFRAAVRADARRQPARGARRLADAGPLERTIERLSARHGELFEHGVAAPTASAMNGGAGFAYALLRIAGVREDPELLALADLWAVRARSEVDAEQAFWSGELGIVPEIFGESSFYHHRGGVECVLALVALARGDEAAARLALDGYVEAAGRDCEHRDVAFGEAGLLLGASLLLEALPAAIDGEPLRAAGDSLRDRLWAELGAEPPLGDGLELRSLGAAHGWAGYLFALLRWSQASAAARPPGLAQRLGELASLARPAGRGLRWPYDAGAPMPHTGLEASWCNGAAGHVFLWGCAHDVLGDERFADLAQRAGWTACESLSPSVGDLCCGWAGRAYAMLSLYRRSGEESWLARAQVHAENAVAGIREGALRRDSLYKGEVGVALLLADLESPEHSCMPLFEGERC